MSSKESKAILKEVREAIKCEKYTEAVEKCEALLQDEPKNYMAYLLLGAAYQNSNKAEAAKHLRKAVEYSPVAPTVALQGLANCAPVEQLPKIYEQLLELVPDKYEFYYEKLFGTTLSNQSDANVAMQCFGVFKRELGWHTQTQERHKLVMKYLARLWIAHNFDVTTEDESNYKIALETAIADTQLDVHLTAYKRYLKLLYKQQDYANCLKHACALTVTHPSDVYAYEWICKIYCETYATAERASLSQQLTQPIEYYVQTLLQLNEHSGLALLINAFQCYEQQQFVTTRDILYRVQSIQPNYAVAVELLARVEMAIGVFRAALPLWQQLHKLQLEYAICLSHMSEATQLHEAVELLLKHGDDKQALTALARCYYKLGAVAELNALPLDALAKAEFLMSPKAALDFLPSAADMESFAALFLIAKLQLQLQNSDAALNFMLKATRLQPHNSECFYYLGKIYYTSNDIVRARKCLEKCINLNPVCEDAVNNLSAIYQQIGEEDINVALLLNTLKHMKCENSKRIHYKLGLHYLNVNKWDDAIQSFRTAIKFDINCMHYWESLGDAYAARGSYNSAVRVFQKILEMDAQNIYAKLQIALIKTTIRMYTEAIVDFDDLLEAHPNYLPGLKGAAEAHIGLANNLKLEHCYGRCKLHLQLALNHLQRVFLKLSGHSMVWLWRLTANVFVQTAQLPTSLAYLEVSGKLAKCETETAVLNRQDLLTLAVRFYTCAAKLKSNTFIWYELALCCYYCGYYMSADAATHLELAIKACKMAIYEQNDRWQNWNLLGVINLHKVIDNLPLAQHCFIQALTIERKSYTTWTNLGVLYLKLNEIKLANQAFQRAQQSSPIYGNAWIGQAMIAEAITEEEEALDLFRHCQQFEYHPESSLGYAHWVCMVLTDTEKCKKPHYKHAIENMYADIVALDAINWYVINEEKAAAAAALSFQGFLSERQKLYRPAAKAYLQAVENAAAGSERDKLLTNLGFLYLKLNEPYEAINAFNKVAQATFQPIIGLALAYVRTGQHQEAYSIYNSVLKSLTGVDDDKAAIILVAMAAMVYASQGEADTKTILYQCILLKDSPIQALYSACSLGILHADTQLTKTILTELKKYENCEQHCAHVAYLTAQYYLSIKNKRKALTYLLSRVHIFPQCAELRNVLATFLLEQFGNVPQMQLATSQIALSSINLMHSSKIKKSDCIADSKSLLIASRALKPVDSKRSIKLIQHAIRLHPQNRNAWQALLEVH